MRDNRAPRTDPARSIGPLSEKRTSRCSASGCSAFWCRWPWRPALAPATAAAARFSPASSTRRLPAAIAARPGAWCPSARSRCAAATPGVSDGTLIGGGVGAAGGAAIGAATTNSVGGAVVGGLLGAVGGGIAGTAIDQQLDPARHRGDGAEGRRPAGHHRPARRRRRPDGRPGGDRLRPQRRGQGRPRHQRPTRLSSRLASVPRRGLYRPRHGPEFPRYRQGARRHPRGGRDVGRRRFVGHGGAPEGAGLRRRGRHPAALRPRRRRRQDRRLLRRPGHRRMPARSPTGSPSRTTCSTTKAASAPRSWSRSPMPTRAARRRCPASPAIAP